ncbi:MAG: DsbA family oxidoreductase, partial [Rhodospirillales bacterium]|nr:DsbA family oxidoreductase [Rhodospirillales bacterium]
VAFHFDVVCPWCYIGKRRLDAAIRMRPSYRVDIVWRLFLLAPNLPRQGIERNAYLKEKYGSIDRAERIFEAADEVGRSAGIAFDFKKMDRASNSINAHRLMNLAVKCGKGDAAIESLFLAYFVNGQDIGKTETLVEVATKLGITAEDAHDLFSGKEGVTPVLFSSRSARNQGINVVPTYVIDDRFTLSGVQNPEVLARAFDSAAAFTINRLNRKPPQR